jgi:catechol 2,3-dioxygenase-like lactoylglutathione lyase family enzyme
VIGTRRDGNAGLRDVRQGQSALPSTRFTALPRLDRMAPQRPPARADPGRSTRRATVSIFTHLTLGTDNLGRSQAFFDTALAPLGIKRLFDMDDRSGYGTDAPQLMIIRPINGAPATAGNGQTVGLLARDQTAVDAFHQAALSAGAQCEGAPGPRPGAANLYAAYVRTPEGHKIAALSFS